jgi:hypothetical protein
MGLDLKVRHTTLAIGVLYIIPAGNDYKAGCFADSHVIQRFPLMRNMASFDEMATGPECNDCVTHTCNHRCAH